MLDIPESSEQGAKKSKGKPYCYRCCTKGHTIHECIVVLCCELFYGDHTTKLCPNSKKTNASAIPCGYAVEGLGFYFIPMVQNLKVNTQERRAVVCVLEGSLTVNHLGVELEKLRPKKNHNWVFRQQAPGPFLLTSLQLTYWTQWLTGVPWMLSLFKARSVLRKEQIMRYTDGRLTKCRYSSEDHPVSSKNSSLFGQLELFWVSLELLTLSSPRALAGQG
jgi:hypothetical protein